MNWNPTKIPDSQLVGYLYDGLDQAQIGLTVFDPGGNTIFENLFCSRLGSCHAPAHYSPFTGQQTASENEARIFQLDNSRWLKIIRRVFPDGNVLCTCTNFTDLKNAQSARWENDRMYRLLADNTLDCIWMMNADLVFTYVNLAVEKMLGFTPEEWIGSGLSEHCSPPEMEKMTDIISDAMVRMDRKPSVLFETELLSKNGTPVPVEILSKFLYDDNGAVTGLQGTTRDIRERRESETVRKDLESQLMQAQKLESLGSLAGGIAHDFNNVLSAVLGFSELAMEDAPAASNIRRYIKRIQEAGYRARELVLQILTFTRQTRVEIRPVQIGKITREALKLLHASLPSTIRIETDIKGNPVILGDPVQVHQILMNLCTNAAYAMREKGGILYVRLETLYFKDGESQKPEGLNPGDYVSIMVSDTGCGIPDSHFSRIFDPFFTSKPVGEGTGMGLAVIKGIIERYKGTITVDSAPERGSTFIVYLPVVKEKFKVRAAKDDLMVGGTERILFVDDEPSIVALGEQILRRLGYRVTACQSSMAAAEIFSNDPDAFDLLLTDITMPGKTGDELAVLTQNIKPGIPVILCTGYSDRVSKEKAREIGVRAFIHKPVSRKDLAKIVRNVLDGATMI
jgi:PAS domain S-box-containing protein